MAGVKGKSGGARPNSGGKREGAGRKRVAAVLIAPEMAKANPGEPLDPRPTLELVALGHLDVSPSQMKALLALLPYVHAKRGEGGKKEQKQAQAEKVASRFAPAAPPRLIAAGGKKV
jgi:phage terminase small subunit